MNRANEALIQVLAMGAVILFCRAFPFLFFSGKNRPSPGENGRKAGSRRAVFLGFVEKTVPPAAMTVLALNALGSSFRENPVGGLLALAASSLTAILHLWKRNSLLSITGGTVFYMFLVKICRL